MTHPTTRRLGLALIALAVGFLTAGTALGSASGARGAWGEAFIWALSLVFAVVGLLIAVRQPGNAIGWIFLSVGLAASAGSLAAGYAGYVITAGRGGSRGLGEFAAAYGNVSWIPFILVPATFLLLLFPDGNLPSRRWRPVGWCAGVGIPLALLTTMAAPGPLQDYPQMSNPYGIQSPLLAPLTGLAVLLVLIGMGGSSAALVARFRRAGGEQRQQIKWLAFAGAGAALTVVVFTVSYDVWGEAVSNVAMMLAVLGLPLAAGVAILRHRLYDIDFVINRTLVYAVLTATLTVAYLGGVLLARTALARFTQDSSLAVAGSTLAVAALFRPARARIQEAVDHRFYRQRYDARRTLESFAARLRDQVDLSVLGVQLSDVVTQAMHPRHASVWLRSEADARLLP